MDYFVHPSAVIDEGAAIGPGTTIWHFCHLMPQCVIGPDCTLGQNVFVAGGVRVGRGSKIQNNVSLYAGLEIGDAVFIGPSAVFTNVKNPRAAVNRRGHYVATVVEDGVTIGANATIVCGVQLHRYAFVGAGTVVTRDVPPYALVVGAPARQLGWVSEAGNRLAFDADGYADCPEGGRYRFADGGVTRID
ncbi:UDP-2-acetamido-3-amino-2,3-dideoxy-glucuronate N-acetyltransferase [Neolewinella xylanilytica]|uniref:UDP-2-acetamido-3-amino-2,3-dideoxy-glucuronate N-acetyltransferase n=1 Tax=Neolewinella xylanilytica TaxID=1514080 RepID=A0A2S6IBI8_9BACT|nr:acyltransferase [Neolewinella xylanilytica]PPK88877.1 UDP-2-acetamido-3-amino-2,3-dideoxy-glucuronate N-acetyltransferase [Neolewinella xylanilytica]